MMILRHRNMGTGQTWGIWPVLLVLLAAVAVPTGCVLWFMNAAMQNERLAVRQKLTDVYRQQLDETQQRLDRHFEHLTTEIESAAALPPPQAFARMARSELADSAVILDAGGQIAYPACSVARASAAELPPPWQAAASKEPSAPLEAAGLYAQLATQATDVHIRARALQAQGRCLARGGDLKAAVAVLSQLATKSELAAATDEYGRVISADAALRLVQLLGGDDPRRADALAQLERRLDNYSPDAALPPAQRLFLMREVRSITGRSAAMLAPEELAQSQADRALIEESWGPDRSAGLLLPAGKGLWRIASRDGRLVVLLRQAAVNALLGKNSPPAGAIPQAHIVQHYGPWTGGKPVFLSVADSRFMPGWEMSLFLQGPDPFGAAADQRNAMYLWTGSLGIAFIAILAMAMASYVGRQIKLNRLKNDFLATVSHELKTPLASMRVLVDTLREGRSRSPQQTCEYFDMISRENERLSRLIDNFLTFSRMERNKRTFELAPVDVAEIVHAAAESMADRFDGERARLTVDLPPGLPRLLADRDAIVTVMLNLLDNAWKYSHDDKAVTIRASAHNGSVVIDVADNGLGLSRRSIRRIFDKFYQVDQTLSRKAGGCGLGLSIVKFILDAHGGSIDVRSQVGQGSTFSVSLPAQAIAVEVR